MPDTDKPLHQGTIKHQATMQPMSEGVIGLVQHMDSIARDGWEVFHVHEMMAGGVACFLVLARRIE